ncbi:uncharacterized protein CELE_F54F2.14 [Caenorhabditis elegans]|uniref:Uncharacterized protein n=1 Tax=Caenorhabditis elegans TaxID=6239 RepID=A0A131MAY4_CAEEL|nr:Uncharacterized protein CELE_F54F2.14 [Caenorhabditis elegans]CZR14519.1 Uncharacterized protein CELE_F54F2.14 [Caenorhabditis elegans]|eukprot:NP_001309598.1 Uncharacterized protein CELE_F54F2.14 [Caenorhabditis elegans]
MISSQMSCQCGMCFIRTITKAAIVSSIRWDFLWRRCIRSL